MCCFLLGLAANANSSDDRNLPVCHVAFQIKPAVHCVFHTCQVAYPNLFTQLELCWS